MAYRPLPAGPPISMEGSQCLGPVEVRYAVSVAGDVDPYAMADEVLVPLEVRTATGGGDRPSAGSFLTVTGAEVSAVRRTPDGALEVRAFNPTDERDDAAHRRSRRRRRRPARHVRSRRSPASAHSVPTASPLSGSALRLLRDPRLRRALTFVATLVMTGRPSSGRVTAQIDSRAVFLFIRFFIVRLSRWRRTPAKQDDTLALFAPISLLMLPVTWLLIIGAAYTVMFWSLEQHGWRLATETSGSSLLTLGFNHPTGRFGPSFLAFSEAALGISLLALLITYLPSMYSAFARRERKVALLEGRAGRPPSAVTMLVRFNTIGAFGQLDALWIDWEEWFVDVEESHSSLSALPFYRSPQPGRSWVTAAGTVLDAGALVEAAVDTPHSARAQLCLRTGFLSLRRIADFFNIAYDPDPMPHDAISITRDEFDDALARLESAGVPLVADRDQAWRDFAGWRVNYDTVLLALASLTMAPPAPWSADRMPAYRRPPVSHRARPGHGQPVTRRWWLIFAAVVLALTLLGIASNVKRTRAHRSVRVGHRARPAGDHRPDARGLPRGVPRRGTRRRRRAREHRALLGEPTVQQPRRDVVGCAARTNTAEHRRGHAGPRDRRREPAPTNPSSSSSPPPSPPATSVSRPHFRPRSRTAWSSSRATRGDRPAVPGAPVT